ncbi:MAG: copper homeostasis protein CutC [Lentimicrobiaceae bacterium]|jgi:copper homeostasis protein|nr:copper homeostasis protein CutC [Lentimicrobiaceae bacterium]
MAITIEVCANSLTSVLNAQAGNADCAELCEALEVGGLTPSYGMLKSVFEWKTIPIRVLIRPRSGNYTYTNFETLTMIRDIQLCKEMGFEGVVLGALTKTKTIDFDVLKKLVEAASGMQLTFHRAIDACRNPFEALPELIKMGFDKILTSGGKPTAEMGIGQITQMQQQFGNQIHIMAGGGINPQNVLKIIESTQITHCHFSASKIQYQGATPENPKDATGALMTWTESNVKTIKTIRKIVDNL